EVGEGAAGDDECGDRSDQRLRESSFGRQPELLSVFSPQPHGGAELLRPSGDRREVLLRLRVSGAPLQPSWLLAVFAIVSVPVAVTDWPLPFGKSWFTVTSGIVKSVVTQLE